MEDSEYRKKLRELEKEDKFVPFSTLKKVFLNRYDLADYYAIERKYLYDKGESLKGMNFRRKIHPILLKVMELDRKYINHQSLTILKDERVKTDKPVIFAISHIGKFDYQIVSEAIKDHQIPFAGDPETMYRTLDGAILGLNGIVYCDTEDKTDRFVATNTAEEVLKQGHNLLIYPEGVWNVTSNLLMLPLFPGIIKMAKDTGCDIVPVAIEQYDKDFIVNIGKNFKVPDIFDETNEKDYIEKKKEELRDVMATLKWEIIESLPQEERKNLGDYAKKNRQFIDTRLNEWFNKRENKPYYNDGLVEHRTYKIKNVTVPKDAFSYFDKIKLNKNTAFMFRKDLSLPIEIQENIKDKLDSNKVR